MDLASVKDFINTIGFPSACTVALGYALWKITRDQKKVLDEITQTNKELTKTNGDLVNKINLVDKINDKVDTLEDKVDKIVDIVERH